MKKLLSMKTPPPALKVCMPGVILAFLATLLFATEARAATRTVTNLNDSGTGSLRDTIAAATSGDEIHFDVTGTIELTSGELRILKNLNILGPGADRLTIARSTEGGTPAFRIFYLQSGASVRIEGLTLTGGLVTGASGNGACIYNDHSYLTVSGCYIHDNTAYNSGGAIYNDGLAVEIFGCTFEANHAANGDGGAVCNRAGSVAAQATTFFRNTAGLSGGALYSFSAAGVSATLSPTDCTFAKNLAYGPKPAASTIQTDGNPSEVDLTNSIINSNPNDAADHVNLVELNGGTINTLGYNLGESRDRFILTDPTDHITDVDPLDPAATQLNGGSVPTIAVMDAPAVDGGKTIYSSDARGVKRPTDLPDVPNASGGNGADIGAYEATDRLQPGLHVVVNSFFDHDDGTCGRNDCTLREAIGRMNALHAKFGTTVPGPYQISFLQNGTITLRAELGELKVDWGMEIIGPGARNLVITANGQHRVFNIGALPSRGAVTISGVTIRDGLALGLTPSGGEGAGGGIFNIADLTLNDCYIFNNRALGGGNSAEAGMGGDANGAGIWNQGNLTLNRCLMANNVAEGGPGGANSSISSLARGGDGGRAFGAAIYNVSSLTLNNCTVAGNASKGGNGGPGSNGGRGGIAVTAIYGAGKVVLTACTISNNAATGGAGGAAQGKFAGTPGTQGLGVAGVQTVTGGSNTFTIRNTIVGDNIGQDANGAFTSEGYNLVSVGDFSSGFAGPGDQVGSAGARIDPKLGSLQNNNGETDTVGLLAGSPALDAGNSFGLTTDQRGFNRPIDLSVPNASDGSDIGAFETALPLDPPPPTPARLGNISTRLRVEAGDDVLIGGFIVTGIQPKRVIIRAIGPSLGRADQLANPTLELYSGQTLLQANDNWIDSPEKQAIIDSTVAPANDLESAIVATLPANGAAYTAVVRGVNDGTGTGLVEIYDLDQTVDSKLANISTRGFVQTDDNVLIAGTIVLGPSSQKVVVRAIGPSLPIAGALADPTLELRNANGDVVRSNDDWRTGGQEAEIIQSTVAPPNDSEAALVETLSGNGASYTAIVRGANNTTGIGVVEVYALQ